MNETVQPSRAVIDPKLMPDTFALLLAAAKRLGYAERLSIEVIREMANAVVHEWVHAVERHQLKNMETIAELERSDRVYEMARRNLVRMVDRLQIDSDRLEAILSYAHEIVCKIPGGLQVVDSHEDADRVIAAYKARNSR